MKFKNIKTIFFATLALLLIQNIIFAQSGKQDRYHAKIEKMKEMLNLSDVQTTELKMIFKEYKGKLKELRHSDLENKRSQVKQIHQDRKEAMKSVLTEEQLVKFEAFKTEEKTRRKAEKSDFRSNKKKEFIENVLPIMLAERQKLEREIDAADKVEINKLRAIAADVKAEFKKEKETSKHEKNRPHGRDHQEHGKKKKFFKALMENHPEAKASAEQLVNKYEHQIDQHQAVIQPAVDKWKAEIKAKKLEKMNERLKHHPEKREAIERKIAEKKAKYEQKRSFGKKLKFLLLDPNASNQSMAEDFQEYNSPTRSDSGSNVYPNPGSDMQTLDFEVRKSGTVNIVIINDSGKVAQEVYNTFMEIGSHSLKVDVSRLSSGTYYYKITDRVGSTTQQMVIIK